MALNMLLLDAKLDKIWVICPSFLLRGTFRKSALQRFLWGWSHVMWKSFKNVDWWTSEKWVDSWKRRNTCKT